MRTKALEAVASKAVAILPLISLLPLPTSAAAGGGDRTGRAASSRPFDVSSSASFVAGRQPDTSRYDAIGTPFFLAEEVDPRAKCLDGSSGVVYVSPSPASSENWVIGSRWGGWCSLDVPVDLTPLGEPEERTVDHCYSRSLYYKGSSINVTEKEESLTGIASGAWYVSRDPIKNPVMWDWNYAWMLNCDGTSLSGGRDDPVAADGPLGERLIYFRGNYIREAAFALLRDRFGLGSGTGSVVVTGQSAGGLASILHVNWWGDKLGTGYNVIGAPDGGFFPDYHTCNSTSTPSSVDPGGGNYKSSRGCFHEHYVESYHDQMVRLYGQSNSILDSACLEHFAEKMLQGGAAEPKKGPVPKARERETPGPASCMFAQHALPFVRYPVFVLNSKFDEWQMEQMLGFTSAEYADKINDYGDMVSRTIVNAVTSSKTLKHGAFIDSCQHHLNQFGAEVGGVTKMEALSQWVNAQITGDWEGVERFYISRNKWPCDECCADDDAHSGYQTQG